MDSTNQEELKPLLYKGNANGDIHKIKSPFRVSLLREPFPPVNNAAKVDEAEIDLNIDNVGSTTRDTIPPANSIPPVDTISYEQMLKFAEGEDFHSSDTLGNKATQDSLYFEALKRLWEKALDPRPLKKHVEPPLSHPPLQENDF